MIDLVCENADSNEEIVASYETVGCDRREPSEEDTREDDGEIATVVLPSDDEDVEVVNVVLPQNDGLEIFRDKILRDILKRQLIEDTNGVFHHCASMANHMSPYFRRDGNDSQALKRRKKRGLPIALGIIWLIGITAFVVENELSKPEVITCPKHYQNLGNNCILPKSLKCPAGYIDIRKRK